MLKTLWLALVNIVRESKPYSFQVKLKHQTPSSASAQLPLSALIYRDCLYSGWSVMRFTHEQSLRSTHDMTTVILCGS